MKINNENEKYILYFIFHTLHFTYQIFMDTCNQISYQLVKRQET